MADLFKDDVFRVANAASYVDKVRQTLMKADFGRVNFEGDFLCKHDRLTIARFLFDIKSDDAVTCEPGFQTNIKGKNARAIADVLGMIDGIGGNDELSIGVGMDSIVRILMNKGGLPGSPERMQAVDKLIDNAAEDMRKLFTKKMNGYIEAVTDVRNGVEVKRAV